MLANKALSSAPSAEPVFVESVFSTYLYTGTGSDQTLTTGVDLSTYGGMIWSKRRSGLVENHFLQDTNRGLSSRISSSTTGAAATTGAWPMNAVSTTGMTVSGVNYAAPSQTYVSWTFRKQAKFFDVVTYTGDGIAGRTVSHNLGSVPGCILVKRLDASGSWRVYHRSLGNTQALTLNTADAAASSGAWNNTTPSATTFTLGNESTSNASGGTYVAYLFAHDAGGFGLTGTDNVISCGSYTGAANQVVTLGWEPQFVLIKNSSGTGHWFMVDNMRGNPVGAAAQTLYASLTSAESSDLSVMPTATGFQLVAGTGDTSINGTGQTYIYIAIRRGPMKVPTSGTSVFSPVAATQSLAVGDPATSSITDDALISSIRTGTTRFNVGDRLRGSPFIYTQDAASAEVSGYYKWDRQTGVEFSSTLTSSGSLIMYHFRRAPGFFDVVAYTGTGANRTVNHSLAAAPELMIIRRREDAAAWWVYAAGNGNTKYQVLNTTAIPVTSSTAWNNTTPTSTVFTVGTGTPVNASGGKYIAYLFASAPGVSKVGSYTGNGTSQTINCSFTGGARFVLIKRTDATGDWYVWDTARGIVTANDPHLSLNTTAAEVTTSDSIDTNSTGFIVNQVATTNINVSAATYIFLAIA